MTRVGFVIALAGALGAAGAATAQPGGRPGTPLKRFGASPEQFWQSSVLRWTGQLSLDLDAVKADVARANITPLGRAAINAQIENTLVQTLELDQLVRQGAAKDKVFAAFAGDDRAFAGLVSAINQSAGAKAATAASLARADAAFHQLAAAVGTGDDSPERATRRLIRLADAIDDAADDLRTLCADQIPGNDRAFDRTLGSYAREARYLARRVRDDGSPDLIRQTYLAMVDRWSESVTYLGRIRNLPPAVGAQSTRVDTLHRKLGAVLNLSPSPAGPDPQPVRPFAFAVGADAGAQPRVTVFADDRGTVAYNFYAYDKQFDGGVRVEMADLNGDRVPDLIVAPGPSARWPQALPVRVYDGRDRNLLLEFTPFAGWKGGLTAAGADLTRNGRALIAVTPDGTPHVKVFDLAQGKEVDSFFARDQKVGGGVRLSWGDANGDGVPDLFTVNGPGNATTVVKVFSGTNREVLAEFPVLDGRYRGGAFVAAGDVTGNGQANAVVGLDAGTVPVVRVFDLRGKPLAEWQAYDERFRGGVRVALSGDGRVVTGPGFGHKNSPARLFQTGNLKAPATELVPFPGFDGGLNVGGR